MVDGGTHDTATQHVDSRSKGSVRVTYARRPGPRPGAARPPQLLALVVAIILAAGVGAFTARVLSTGLDPEPGPAPTATLGAATIGSSTHQSGVHSVFGHPRPGTKY
jgi:hypothetical protein